MLSHAPSPRTSLIVPLPTLVFIALATGLVAALSGRIELRVTPRPALLTQSFIAFAIFTYLVLVPVGVYFYVFHGDWFLLYWVDVRSVPSALALVGFALVGGVSALGFATGAALVRTQRDGVVAALALLALAGGGAVILLAKDRLALVGSYTQFERGFGLETYGSGALMLGTLLMSAILVVAFLGLVLRLHQSGRKGI